MTRLTQLFRRSNARARAQERSARARCNAVGILKAMANTGHASFQRRRRSMVRARAQERSGRARCKSVAILKQRKTSHASAQRRRRSMARARAQGRSGRARCHAVAILKVVEKSSNFGSTAAREGDRSGGPGRSGSSKEHCQLARREVMWLGEPLLVLDERKAEAIAWPCRIPLLARKLRRCEQRNSTLAHDVREDECSRARERGVAMHEHCAAAFQHGIDFVVDRIEDREDVAGTSLEGRHRRVGASRLAAGLAGIEGLTLVGVVLEGDLQHADIGPVEAGSCLTLAERGVHHQPNRGAARRLGQLLLRVDVVVVRRPHPRHDLHGRAAVVPSWALPARRLAEGLEGRRRHAGNSSTPYRRLTETEPKP
mmetsp:Transcript_175656/g.563322  ORF Transcript_175656/g.563322 Transcript_175656/m.563322 type:complete len:370 (-) Transcript_175656:15-1124(-)